MQHNSNKMILLNPTLHRKRRKSALRLVFVKNPFKKITLRLFECPIKVIKKNNLKIWSWKFPTENTLLEINIEVPQGSAVVPVFFVIYVNDLSNFFNFKTTLRQITVFWR